jgi:hypothetical protein
MFEVPAYDQAAPTRGCQGHMQSIGGLFFTNNAGLQVSVLQGDTFCFDWHQIGARQEHLELPANMIRRKGQFIGHNARCHQLETAAFDLLKKFPARLINARVENASVNGGVSINADWHVGYHSYPLAEKSSQRLSRSVAQLAHIDPSPVGGTPTLLEAPGGADAMPMIRGCSAGRLRR